MAGPAQARRRSTPDSAAVWGDRDDRLATNRARIYVVAQAEIFGMSHLAVRRPLREGDLDHDLRARPVRPLVSGRPRRERARGRLQGTQDCGHPSELALAEAGARVADGHERGALPDTEQESAEVRPPAAAFGPTSDDAFLLPQNLDLAPGAAAASGLVGRIELLGEETFPASREDLPVERSPVTGSEVREPQP